MKVYIDGKEIKCNSEVRVVIEVEPREGISSESDLEYIIHKEGIVASLTEVTRTSAPSAEFTYEFWEDHEEFIDQYMLQSLKGN
jgi:hypothetical protein